MSIIAYAADEHSFSSSSEVDEEDSDGSNPEGSHKEPGTIKPLLDLSAKVVAKSCNCEVLEHSNPPLDEELLRKVRQKTIATYCNLAHICCIHMLHGAFLYDTHPLILLPGHLLLEPNLQN